MSKTDLYNDLIEFNKTQQINSRIDLCKRDSQHPVCNNVSMNDNDEWYQYYSKNDNEHLFSKGRDRFEKWKELESIELYNKKNKQRLTYIHNKKIKQRLTNIHNSNKQHFYFVIAALIIIFQVFGDGNHRTAVYYFKKMTKSTIEDIQMTGINNILSTFNYPPTDDKLLSIINELNNIISNDILRGGKTTIKKRTKKRYTQRRKTIL